MLEKLLLTAGTEAGKASFCGWNRWWKSFFFAAGTDGGKASFDGWNSCWKSFIWRLEQMVEKLLLTARTDSGEASCYKNRLLVPMSQLHLFMTRSGLFLCSLTLVFIPSRKWWSNFSESYFLMALVSMIPIFIIFHSFYLVPCLPVFNRFVSLLPVFPGFVLPHVMTFPIVKQHDENVLEISY